MKVVEVEAEVEEVEDSEAREEVVEEAVKEVVAMQDLEHKCSVE